MSIEQSTYTQQLNSTIIWPFFLMRIKQKNGSDYEPITLKRRLGFFEWILNSWKYGISLEHVH